MAIIDTATAMAPIARVELYYRTRNARTDNQRYLLGKKHHSATQLRPYWADGSHYNTTPTNLPSTAQKPRSDTAETLFVQPQRILHPCTARQTPLMAYNARPYI